MSKKIKLIWEFRGPAAAKTAEHHVIHLKDYIALEQLTLNETSFEVLSEFSAVAHMIIEEHELEKVREALKPHRGQYYNQ